VIRVTLMEGYLKLKGAEIAATTVWSADPRTRLLFVCLLIAADDHGFVNWPGTTNVRMIEDFGLGKDGCVDAMERLIELGFVRLEASGVWLIESERFRDKQTKKQAMAANRVRQCRERKKNKTEASPVTKRVTGNRRGPVTVLRDGTYEDSKNALHVTKRTNSTSTSTSTNTSTNTTSDSSRSRGSRVHRPHGVGEEVWKDYLQLRKMKKAPVTDRVISIISKEAAKAGVSLEEAMLNCVSHGWSGFKAEWLNKRGSAQKVRTESASHEAGEIDF